MKRCFLILIAVLLMATVSCAPCYRSIPCEPWPDEPLLFSHVDGAGVLLVTLMPDEVDRFVVYWGDRMKEEFSGDLPVILEHEYSHDTAHRIRLLTFNGTEILGEYQVEN